MLFNSITFLIFFIIVFLIYWGLLSRHRNLQNLFLLAASFLFYGWWDWRFLGLLILSATVDFLVALNIDSSKNNTYRKHLLLLSIIVNLSILGFFKYFNFFIDSAADLLAQIGLQTNPSTLNIILPVGISFYTFQSLSYSIDVYRKNIKPTKNPLVFFAYVSFFPQLVAGPIERAKNLLPQFSNSRKFDWYQIQSGLNQVIWGFFKKLVIADNCAIQANQIFQNPAAYDSGTLWLGAIYFAFQIYGDFSGYSDIAIGTARMLGFKLMTNFSYPYFSRDIAEFWRRWHISLSSWFRDYVYVPLGGSRSSKPKVILNVFIIFLLSGFWHGANWTFILWGFLNAIYFIPQLIRNTNRDTAGSIVAEHKAFPSVQDTVRMSSTFVLCLIAWVVFRSGSAADAATYIFRMLFTLPEFPDSQNLTYLPLLLLLIIIEWVSRHKEHPLLFSNYGNFQSIFAVFAVFWITIIWGNFGLQEFIYFQF